MGHSGWSMGLLLLLSCSCGLCSLRVSQLPEPANTARTRFQGETAPEPSQTDQGSAWPLPIPHRAADGSFPAKLSWNGGELIRNGTGLCEWGILGIDLYEAAFYSERRVRDVAEALDPDQRTVIHLHFVRKLTAAQLSEAFTAAIRANAGDHFASHEESLRKLVSVMETVRAGDSYSFFAEPGRGLTIARDGHEVTRVEDDEFRRLFLRLYLGDRPPTEALRDALLGKED